MTSKTSSAEFVERIEDIDVASEMRDSFLEYAYSVIYSRALPDARDGLKPVQRRILFQMNEMGLRPDKGHVKSARVVGEVMGKLHPHGDASIYDALVRMAQDFSLRLPLVDGHGNFGSLDDGPAASRYTEARLAGAALAMTANLDEDVVDFVPNYDNQLQQPDVLPSAYPNLLVNGASGIAVGMATNMAPHNLIEVIEAAIFLLHNPAATLDELMAFVPGPDLPSGGVIMGLDGIREAYETGRGSFRTRARVSVESVSSRKMGIIVTELPYLVGPEKVIEKIKDGVQSKKLSGISNVVDLTDRHHGLKLIIEIKTGFSPEAVLEQLYRFTPLEDSFSINNVALVNGGPQTLGLRQMLEVYVGHRKSVVERRSQYRLRKRQERLHLVSGLIIAIVDIDEVIQLIRQSDDTEQARTRLMDVFELSQLQADYILELRLRRLTKFSRVELESEAESLRQEIAELELILSSSKNLIDVVASELSEVSRELGSPRRTVLSTSTVATSAQVRASASASLEIADSPAHVLLSSSGRLVRADHSESSGEPSGGLSQGTHRTAHDAIAGRVSCTRRGNFGVVTSGGRLLVASPVELPGVPATSVSMAAGVKVEDYIDVDRGETVIGLVDLLTTHSLAIGTRDGIVKRVTSEAFPAKSGQPLISLKDNDAVVGICVVDDASPLIFITSDAQLLNFTADNVRPQGAAAGGMAGIRLAPHQRVIFFGTVHSEDSSVVTVSTSSNTLLGTDTGRAKCSLFSEFPAKGRGTGGVRAQSLLKGEDSLAVAWAGDGSPVANGLDGTPRELPTEYVKRDASGEKLSDDVSFIGSTLS
ncbi:DNA topoisomerase IV subunit A [Alpinimonas psychrophila]|uniref:DNA topoisomerase (ATP-hydrolyzing) n=1 Tax=Alpinimonas psychrophila TaxID=748908 RepID=A0A7W3JSQ5_9MICO|nr:DNA topoisomerase IV subunit A [Alpinimonas psychrophila]MBA8828568.1 DNA gyrase subunit A [Alpinimonas psychrophila]